MYRLESGKELFEIGWEDYLERNGVYAVEWSENVSDVFDGTEINVYIERISDTVRRITVKE
jgi:tRNA threonylcarbamoyladenosine biosynthesis protein TsaE